MLRLPKYVAGNTDTGLLEHDRKFPAEDGKVWYTPRAKDH